MLRPDKILMRKIKKLEEHKLKLLSQKTNNAGSSTEDEDSCCSKKRPHSENFIPDGSTKKLKKQKQIVKNLTKDGNDAVETESEDEEKYSPKKQRKKRNHLKVVNDSDSDSYDETESMPDKKSQNNIPLTKDDFTLDSKEFSCLQGKVCDATLKGIQDMGFSTMTDVQYNAYSHLLRGGHLVCTSKTGSGKTLAFLLPAIEIINKIGFKPRNGTGAIILTPTRELAIQTFGVLQSLMKHHRHTIGLLIGGGNRKLEARKLFNGANILLATPGRLLDHLKGTPDFVYKNLVCLVIDEADRLLEIGYEKEIKKIFELLPEKRQTMLFTATRPKKMDGLVALAFQNKKPMYIGIDDNAQQATVDTLEQGYLKLESGERINALFTFLRKCRRRKVIVFFSTCNSVEFHNKFFNYVEIEVMAIHGKQEQSLRTNTYFKFCKAETGILLCTDVVARGLDIPAVDFIFQYDPPDDPKEYIHRVGRTARGLGTSGHAIIFLRPEEMGFLKLMHQEKVTTITEYDLQNDKQHDIELSLQNLLSINNYLRGLAMEGMISYIRAYDSHRLKNIFEINKLHLNKVARDFGFTSPPASVMRELDKIQSLKRKDVQNGHSRGAKFNKNKNFGHKNKRFGKSFS